jgi:hypothetical protein
MSRRRVYKDPGLVPSNGHAPSRNGRGPRPEPLETCTVVCPRCGGPMTARCGRGGPYFHCLCYERPRGPAAAGGR